MAKKSGKSTGGKTCTCNKCLLEAHSIPGTTHRRCSGNAENNTPRPKGENIPGANRGRWE
jgi:hypothetical protein